MVAGKSFGLVIILLIVLAAEQMVEQTEARLCESQSHSFKGQCWSDHNCGLACKTEGAFVGGKCRGFRHRCFCAKNC